MKRFILYIGSILFLFLSFTNAIFANPITLKETPNQNAKSVGTINPEKGIMVIYIPENSAWAKVADPNNGLVGWIEKKDLQSGTQTQVFYSQKIINGDEKQNFQWVKVGGDPLFTEKDKEEWIKNFEKKQIEFQKNMQSIMNHLFSEVKGGISQFPTVMPVIFVPVKSEPATQSQTHQQSTTQTTQSTETKNQTK